MFEIFYLKKRIKLIHKQVTEQLIIATSGEGLR